jgi:arabinogalactan oligomer/maltooligosaccharide transport system permease protein
VILTHAFLIAFTAGTLLPLAWVLKMALSPGHGFAGDLSLLPSEPTLANFVSVVAHRDLQGAWVFGHQALNSVLVSVATSALGIAVACSAGYAFSRFRFKGRRAGLNAFLVSQTFPGVMMMIPLYIILKQLDLLNSRIGLVIVYATTSVPFCVWMLKGYFDTIPREIEESAIMDGAGRLTIFLRIMVPLAAPAIAVTGLFSFMTAWNEFVLAFTFMDRETAFTLPVMVQRFVGEHDVQWGMFAASSVIVSIPVMALFFVLEKHLVGGLTAGGVKG